jgi:large conductance mechanosensitive channel
MHMLQDFKKFVTKGNVLDLAVAVIIGIAFGLLVNSFVKDIIMPIVGAVVGKPTFDDLTLGIGDGVIRYGSFLTLLVNFLIIAFVLFLIVQAAEKLQSLRGAKEIEADPTEVELLVEIRDLLRQQRGA